MPGYFSLTYPKITINYGAAWVAFTANTTNLGVPAANVVMHNMSTNGNKVVTSVNGSSVARPAMYCPGSYVVFGIGA